MRWILFSLLLLLMGCVNTDGPLEVVEIREYQGEKLDSWTAFRENSIRGPQHIEEENYTLIVDGLVSDEMELKYKDVLGTYNSYEKAITLFCVEGWKAKILWKGILLKDLLTDASVKESANTVIFHAEDGYTSSLPLDYILENDIMLAFEMNGLRLPAERGFPFQVVAESKWGYKWVKWVIRIELSDDPEYKGFWEKRGYSNTGNLDEGFFS